MKPNTPLAALREKIQAQKWKGKTQKQIAKEIGVTPGFLSNVLHGRKKLTLDMLSYAGFVKTVTVNKRRK
jgi:transcriptional regulator with XRE-family HTH domain